MKDYIKEAYDIIHNSEYMDSDVEKYFGSIYGDKRLLIVSGYSDDIIAFNGFTRDEYYSDVYLDDDFTVLENRCEENCVYFMEKIKNAKWVITGTFGGGDKYSWEFDTNIPLEFITFADIKEDEYFYCKVMIIDVEGLLNEQ